VIMDNAPAVVGGLVKEVEEREEVGKVRMDGIATGDARTDIEHVDNVKGNEEAGLLVGWGCQYGIGQEGDI
jgi:hypothetical protein